MAPKINNSKVKLKKPTAPVLVETATLKTAATAGVIPVKTAAAVPVISEEEKKKLQTQYPEEEKKLVTFKTALELIKAAAQFTIFLNAGIEAARRNLWHIYTLLDKTTKDSKNLVWLHKGAFLGNPEAQYELGNRTKDGSGITLVSFMWFQTAILSGITGVHLIHSQYEVGCALLNGINNITQDTNKGILYLTAAANAGDIAACRELGQAYYSGIYIRKDPLAAVEWFEKERKLRNDEDDDEDDDDFELVCAWRFLGISYQKALHGITKSRKLAVFWLEKAVEAGDSQAECELALLLLRGDADERKKGLQLLELSVAHDNARACFELGLLHEDGQIVKQDPKMALEFFQEGKRYLSVEADASLEEDLNNAIARVQFSRVTLEKQQLPNELKNSKIDKEGCVAEIRSRNIFKRKEKQNQKSKEQRAQGHKERMALIADMKADTAKAEENLQKAIEHHRKEAAAAEVARMLAYVSPAEKLRHRLKESHSEHKANTSDCKKKSSAVYPAVTSESADLKEKTVITVPAVASALSSENPRAPAASESAVVEKGVVSAAGASGPDAKTMPLTSLSKISPAIEIAEKIIKLAVELYIQQSASSYSIKNLQHLLNQVKQTPLKNILIKYLEENVLHEILKSVAHQGRSFDEFKLSNDLALNRTKIFYKMMVEDIQFNFLDQEKLAIFDAKKNKVKFDAWQAASEKKDAELASVHANIRTAQGEIRKAIKRDQKVTLSDVGLSEQEQLGNEDIDFAIQYIFNRDKTNYQFRCPEQKQDVYIMQSIDFIDGTLRCHPSLLGGVLDQLKKSRAQLKTAYRVYIPINLFGGHWALLNILITDKIEVIFWDSKNNDLRYIQEYLEQGIRWINTEGDQWEAYPEAKINFRQKFAAHQINDWACGYRVILEILQDIRGQFPHFKPPAELVELDLAKSVNDNQLRQAILKILFAVVAQEEQEKRDAKKSDEKAGSTEKLQLVVSPLASAPAPVASAASSSALPPAPAPVASAAPGSALPPAPAPVASAAPGSALPPAPAPVASAAPGSALPPAPIPVASAAVTKELTQPKMHEDKAELKSQESYEDFEKRIRSRTDVTLEELESLAYKNHRAAQQLLAYLYWGSIPPLANLNLALNNEKVAFWSQKFAESGDPIAQLNYGTVHLHGVGVSVDEKLALHWYEKSAAQNNVQALYNCGLAYKEGCGAFISVAKAKEYFNRAIAVDQNKSPITADSQEEIEELNRQQAAAEALDADSAYAQYLEFTEHRDHGDPLPMLWIAADKKHPEARSILSMRCFTDGLYHKKQNDLLTTMLMFKTAYQYGHTQAAIEAGILYRNTNLSETNIDQKDYLDFDEHAAELGIPEAQFAMSCKLYVRKHSPKDQKQSEEWLKKSLLQANQEILSRVYAVALAFYYGENVAQDLPHALELLTAAAEKGFSPAQKFIAECKQLETSLAKEKTFIDQFRSGDEKDNRTLIMKFRELLQGVIQSITPMDRPFELVKIYDRILQFDWMALRADIFFCFAEAFESVNEIGCAVSCNEEILRAKGFDPASFPLINEKLVTHYQKIQVEAKNAEVTLASDAVLSHIYLLLKPFSVSDPDGLQSRVWFFLCKNALLCAIRTYKNKMQSDQKYIQRGFDNFKRIQWHNLTAVHRLDFLSQMIVISKCFLRYLELIGNHPDYAEEWQLANVMLMYCQITLGQQVRDRMLCNEVCSVSTNGSWGVLFPALQTDSGSLVHSSEHPGFQSQQRR